ncbi:MAG: sugar ABC transporter permease YjfF [Clostridiales bacterium]|nr:sugar ABC transporter permease YjfF [Clostridiales bacterium]
MSKANTTTVARREPVTNANLLMRISIGIFLFMYIMAIVVWGGGYKKPQMFLDILNNNAFLIIIGCSLTIVMITGGIDISVGGVVGLVSMIVVMFLKGKFCSLEGMSPGIQVACAAGIAILVGLAFGAVQGALVAYLEIQPFIITLAGMFFARGMITILSPIPVQLTSKENGALVDILQHRTDIPFLGAPNKKGVMIPARIEIGIYVALAVLIIIAIMLRKSRLGRNFYAVGGNRQSALMLGINVRKTRFLAHLISGLLAGIAGFVYITHTVSGNATNASASEMDAIASSIIGGTLLSGGVGNVIGTFFGVLILATIKSIVLSSGLREPWWQTITTGLLLCFFILMQSIILSYRGKGKKQKDAIVKG